MMQNGCKVGDFSHRSLRQVVETVKAELFFREGGGGGWVGGGGGESDL